MRSADAIVSTYCRETMLRTWSNRRPLARRGGSCRRKPPATIGTTRMAATSVVRFRDMARWAKWGFQEAAGARESQSEEGPRQLAALPGRVTFQGDRIGPIRARSKRPHPAVRVARADRHRAAGRGGPGGDDAHGRGGHAH